MAGRQILRALIDIIFPPVCIHCGEITDGSAFENLCPKCAASLAWARGPQCKTCGHPFYGDVPDQQVCVHCADLVPAFTEGRTLLLLRGASRTFVHYLKYRGGVYLTHDMITIFRDQEGLPEFLRGGWLVPVPLSARKKRERGYNQSELIAEAVASVGGPSVRVVRLLKKTLDTPSQTTFDRRERQRNLKNAFALASGASLIPHQKIILIDDVFTTGSTLNACARTLRVGGFQNLYVLTLGHG